MSKTCTNVELRQAHRAAAARSSQLCSICRRSAAAYKDARRGQTAAATNGCAHHDIQADGRGKERANQEEGEAAPQRGTGGWSAGLGSQFGKLSYWAKKPIKARFSRLGADTPLKRLRLSEGLFWRGSDTAAEPCQHFHCAINYENLRKTFISKR